MSESATNAGENPADGLDTLVVDPDDVVGAFRRNKRDEDEQRTHVLRVSPPFKGEQTASLHVSEGHAHYPPEMEPKPIHVGPAAFLVGHDLGVWHPDYRDEWGYPDISQERSRYRSEVPESDQDDESWEEWWDVSLSEWEGRVRHALQQTDELVLTSQHPDIEDTTVSVQLETEE
jgi:hypothetical protein